MVTNKKRSHSRHNCQAAIQYANFNTEKFQSAKMFNCSASGLYFETEDDVAPGSDIKIKMVDHQPNIHGAETCKFYRAQVKWSRSIKNAGTNCFGIGAQYIHKSLAENDSNYFCGLCWKSMPKTKSYQIDDFVYLCPECSNRFKDIPDGLIKESIERFLNGNVV
jgi:hypothetical protein